MSAPALATVTTPAGIFHPESFTLANGMQVVLIENHRAPIVSHMVWFRVGAADDPVGHSGIAHFFEHLMFKGTKKVAAGEISRIIAKNGGDDNAFTSYDFTSYYSNIAVDRLPLIMELEADRMQNLNLDPEILRTERDVVIEERKQTVESDPSRRLQEQMQAALLSGLPYGTPIIGWHHEIEKLDKTHADSFYANWYAPNNAILVISGDITVDKLKPLAEQFYGSIPARHVPVRNRPARVLPPTQQRITVTDEDVQLPILNISYVAPTYGASDNATMPYALQVLMEIFGEGATSRLYRTLVMQQNIASSVGVYYNPVAMQRNALSLYAAPLPGAGLENIEAQLHAEVKKLLAQGVTDAEVAEAKKRLIAHATYARDSVMHPAYLFGMALTIGQTVDDVEAWPDRIAAVQTADVNAAARAVFDTDDYVTGELLPETISVDASGVDPSDTP